MKTELLLMLLVSPNSGLSQSALHGSPKNNPHVSPGRLVAEGESNRPFGNDKLLTYKLEEVDLADPIDLAFRSKRHHLSSVMRLTITSDSIGGAHTM